MNSKIGEKKLIFSKTNTEYNIKKLKKEHQIDIEIKKNKNLQFQTKLTNLWNKIDILENKIFSESFKASDKIKKNNNNRTKYDLDNKYDFIKIKTARQPNIRSKLIKKIKEKDNQRGKNIFNSLYLLPKSKSKNKRIFVKNISSSFINGLNRENETYFCKNRNNSSVEESINNFIFNINDYDNNGNKNAFNNSAINFSSNKLINMEKVKIKQKLEEYHKQIDKKLNKLRSNKPYKVNELRNSFINFKLVSKDKNNKNNNNFGNISLNSEKIKKKVICTSNKSHRSVNKSDRNKI